MSCSCSFARGVSRWFTPLACGPGSPQLSKFYMDMTSKLFTFTFTCNQKALCAEVSTLRVLSAESAGPAAMPTSSRQESVHSNLCKSQGCHFSAVDAHRLADLRSGNRSTADTMYSQAPRTCAHTGRFFSATKM